jgi:hypothetical protein
MSNLQRRLRGEYENDCAIPMDDVEVKISLEDYEGGYYEVTREVYMGKFTKDEYYESLISGDPVMPEECFVY